MVQRLIRRVLLLFVLTGVAFFLTFQHVKHFPFSLIYRSTHSESAMVNASRQLNEVRVKNAIKYLESVTAKKDVKIPPTKPQLSVVIITIARSQQNGRKNPRYLTQTLAAMDLLLKKDKFFDRKFMFMCNVDKHPDKHTEAVTLQNHFPYVNKNGETNMGINVNAVKNVVNNFDPVRRQESEDYVFCLNVSHSLNSSYVLVLEDDVFPTENLLEVISYTLQYRMRREQNDVIANRKFSYIKLYYPVKWQGFANEADRVLELIALGTLGGTVTVVIAIMGLFGKAREQQTSHCHLFTAFIYGLAITIFISLMIGRVNIISLRHIHPQLYRLRPTPGCCTPAMLYASDVIPGLMDFLIYNNSQAKDLGIYSYTQKQALPGYQLEPNLFMHTGMISSLSDLRKKPEEFAYDISNILH